MNPPNYTLEAIGESVFLFKHPMNEHLTAQIAKDDPPSKKWLVSIFTGGAKTEKEIENYHVHHKSEYATMEEAVRTAIVFFHNNADLGK